MKNLSIYPTSSRLYLAVLLIVLFAFATQIDVPAATGGPTPESKEISGTHMGSKTKDVVPWNMVMVPAGKVIMGMEGKTAIELSEGQPEAFNSFSRCTPKHTVKVGSFCCDLFEVTNHQWKTYLDATGQKPSQLLMGLAWKRRKKGKDKKDEEVEHPQTYPEGQANLPLRNVSLREARDFARWVGKRIPTEQEWTRAAAGDDGRTYAWGNDWNRGKNCTNRKNALMPVGSYEDGRSPFGIYDLTGSMWEWTDSPFEAYPKYKILSQSIPGSKKKLTANPGFNPQQYVAKGGHYMYGDLANRLEVREPMLPTDNMDTLGFRCVKDSETGHTLLHYARRDLEGSCISDEEVDYNNLYAMEVTYLSDSEPKVITGYDGLFLCPMGKQATTIEKIKKNSPDTPFPIAVLSVTRPLEEPNLPPGSYVIAYRHQGLTAEQKKALAAKEEAKKIAEEAQRKREAEEKKKADEEAKKDDKPKSQEEIDAEKARKAEAEEARRLKEEKEKADAKAQAALEKIGAVSKTKEHIEYPADKNLIVFMNANDSIVGYLEIEEMKEDQGMSPIRVVHGATSGMTDIELCTQIYGKIPRFNFSLKIKDNPF